MQIEDILEMSGLWAGLAEAAGLPAGGWSAQVVSQRRDAARHRVVWRLDRAGVRLALRRVFAPIHPQAFLNDIQAHLAVQERFDEVAQLRAVDADAQVSLMDWAGTETFFDVLSMDGGSGARAEALRRAGGWVARFHRSGYDTDRVFQPRHSVRHLTRLMDEVRRGLRPVADSAAWLDCSERLCALQSRFEGRRTVACLGHGDLNLRNIMFADQGLRGLDFRDPGAVPVGHDLARLFVHYGALLSGADAVEGPLPGVDLRGFFTGYDLVGPEDPSVGFLSLMRILIDWQTLPAETGRHSLAQRQRYLGLRRLAVRAFGD